MADTRIRFGFVPDQDGTECIKTGYKEYLPASAETFLIIIDGIAGIGGQLRSASMREASQKAISFMAHSTMACRCATGVRSCNDLWADSGQ